jgi:integrase
MRGVDPLDERNAQKLSKRQAEAAKKAEARRDELTLARAARAYHERVIEPQRTAKHAAQWISSLENHVPAVLWHKPIADIAAPELLDCIVDVHARVPETARRMLQRLDAVFDDCVFRTHCSGNPAAAIKRKLREFPGVRERGEFGSLDYRIAPEFMRKLRAIPGTSARCLEFTILTVARTNESIGCCESEFDLHGGVWTVPPARMKSSGKKKREKHVVYLCPRAIQIVQDQIGLDPHYVFPSAKLDGRPLSNMAMLMQLRRMGVAEMTTVHGFRSTFSTWANETGMARPDVIEACLAHQEENRVRAAYNRAQFTKERATLLVAWADFLNGQTSASNVVEFSSERVAA